MNLHIPSKRRFHQVKGNEYVVLANWELSQNANPKDVALYAIRALHEVSVGLRRCGHFAAGHMAGPPQILERRMRRMEEAAGPHRIPREDRHRVRPRQTAAGGLP